MDVRHVGDEGLRSVWRERTARARNRSPAQSWWRRPIYRPAHIAMCSSRAPVARAQSQYAACSNRPREIAAETDAAPASRIMTFTEQSRYQAESAMACFSTRAIDSTIGSMASASCSDSERSASSMCHYRR